MDKFPANTKFIYPWRTYQKRVLDKLEYHLEDRHLHVIAPPGSGKTVLGLEALIRLNKPTLVLAPTLTIRDQWIQRLCELFLETTTVPDWVSTDIRKPAFFTVSTYQGLHMACTAGEMQSTIDQLKKLKIGTIVVDEAHHLRNEWCHTLDTVKAALKPFIIGLTATPPYDTSFEEWVRYIDLNGEIDIEIPVPELIAAGDLCPHQDYVYFSTPTPVEYERINKYRHNISSIMSEYRHSPLLVEAITTTAIWKNPKENLNWIYANFDVYTSFLIYLHTNGIEITEPHFEVIGIDIKEPIPILMHDRLALVLNYFIFQSKDLFTEYADQKEDMLNKLKRHGAIESGLVNFTYNSDLNKMLIASNSKLASIGQIVDFEYQQLQTDLRMVVLTDYIRKEYLAYQDQDVLEFKKMGLIPMFEYLQANNKDNKRIGVLSGSLTILPKEALPKLQRLATNLGVEDISSAIKEYRSKHIIIESDTAFRGSLVALVTQLFDEGDVQILLGTKALLGEGWDAPCINSLIMASFIGSFVLSNQMRGRAIRTQKGNADKTSNIWHLVCLDPTIETGGQDLEILKRRFNSFLGVSYSSIPYIENGLDRLELVKKEYNDDIVSVLNTRTFEKARERTHYMQQWTTAINSGNRMVDEIRLPPQSGREHSQKKMKTMYMNKTLGYLSGELLFAIALYTQSSMKSVINNPGILTSYRQLIHFLTGFCVMGCLFFGWQIFKTLRLYISYRDIAKDISQIGEALLLSFTQLKMIRSTNLQVVAYEDHEGAVYSYLDNANSSEQTLYINALQEIVSPIKSPRYVIIRKNKLWKLVQQKDFHSVPEVLGRNKSTATFFADNWQRLVGRSQLLYTRTMDGRKQLLHARSKSLSAQLNEEVLPEQVRKWS